MTFDEMAAQRDPLYAATKAHGEFEAAVRFDLAANDPASPAGLRGVRDMTLLALALKVLKRNQGEPYYRLGGDE